MASWLAASSVEPTGESTRVANAEWLREEFESLEWWLEEFSCGESIALDWLASAWKVALEAWSAEPIDVARLWVSNVVPIERSHRCATVIERHDAELQLAPAQD